MKLTIRVTPNARTSAILGWRDGVLFVRVHAPPRDGNANTELISLLASTFHLPKSSLLLVRGATNRMKVVELPISTQDLERLPKD